MRQIALLLHGFFVLAPVAGAQWSTPTPLTNLNGSGTDFYPTPTFDGLTLYYVSDRSGNPEIYRTTRAAPYTGFAAPTLVSELSDPASELGIGIRIDQLEIFFSSARAGGAGGQDIWRADRASSSAPFNPPVPVPELDTSGEEWMGSLSMDGLRIYFTSNRAGGAGDYDIWTAVRPNWASPFGAATPVVELNSPQRDRDARISPDGLTVFFASNRAGGAVHLWLATRLDTASPFGVPVSVPGLNSTAADFTPGFVFFHDEIFFTSQRPGGLGVNDLFTARFTGLLGVGVASASSSMSLRFSDPASPGLIYLAAAALGSAPGIPIDTRVLPLNFDLLFQLTIGGLAPVMTGYVGVLDPDGIASGTISFAGFGMFRGLRFFNAFVVIDPTAPSGIKTISNAHEVLVQ